MRNNAHDMNEIKRLQVLTRTGSCLFNARDVTIFLSGHIYDMLRCCRRGYLKFWRLSHAGPFLERAKPYFESLWRASQATDRKRNSRAEGSHHAKRLHERMAQQFTEISVESDGHLHHIVRCALNWKLHNPVSMDKFLIDFSKDFVVM